MNAQHHESARKPRMEWRGTLRLAFVVGLAIPLGLPLGNCTFLCDTAPQTAAPVWEVVIAPAGRLCYGQSLAEAPNGDLLAAGVSTGGSGADGFVLARRAADGSAVWTQEYTVRNEYTGRVHVAAAADGGALLFGEVGYEYEAPNLPDYSLIRVDETGAKQWEKRIGGARSDYALDAVAVADGFVLLGTTTSHGSGGTDLELIRVADGGDVLWSRTYGGSANDYAVDLEATTDGGFAILGETASFGHGENDLYLIKTNADGEEQWYGTYGYSNYSTAAGLRQTSDGGFILAGSDADVYIVKTDAEGALVWEKLLRPDETSYLTVGGIAVSPDGAFALTGSSSSFGEEVYFCNAAFVMEISEAGDLSRSSLYGEYLETDGAQILTTQAGKTVIIGTAGGYLQEQDEFRREIYLAEVQVDGTT